MLLAGSFSEYPLSLLLEIFLHRSETGLLEVSSPKQSGYFFIKNGKIKGGEVGKLRGVAAAELAGSFADASFQFKPLEPTDYAQVVWEKSYGSNRLVTDTPDVRIEAFRAMLQQLRSYSEAAHGILQRAIVSLAQRALRQLLFYAPAAYRSFKKPGVSLARRTLVHATAVYEFSKRAQVRRKLLTGLRKALAACQIALRRNKEINKETIFNDADELSFQGAPPLIRKSAPRLPSLKEVAQSNISFAVIMVALLAGIAVTIFQFLRSNQDRVNTLTTADENIGTQSQTQPGNVSRERGQRKPRISRQTPAEKKRDARLASERRFLPRVANLQAPRNEARDSDDPTEQPAPTGGVQTIPVVLQIENGRVSQASLVKHRTGLESYEAAALQIARQRRYRTAGKHTETVVVKVNQPN